MIDVLREIYFNEGVHMRALSRRLDLGMPAVKNQVDKLLEEKFIVKKDEGRNIKLFINKKNKFITPYLYEVEYTRLKSLPKIASDAVFDLLASLENKPVIVMIFGSYARGTFSKSSDLDVMLVFSHMDTEAERKAKIIGSRHSVKLEPVYLTWKSFKKKFFDEKDIFIKELKKNKIIITGLEYWRMLENEKA
jgi:predicted nucleotidyltransferase